MAPSSTIETTCTPATEAGDGTNSVATAATDVGNNVHNNSDNDDSNSILASLHRLSLSLQELDDKTLYTLSHYRKLPNTLVQAYDILQQGAALIHGTSTKFTLMEKIANSHVQTREMAQNLLKGCELVGTACLVLHQPSTGTSTACRHYVKQASRAIVQTVHQLVQTFHGADCAAAAHEEDNTLGAQRTGAVWQTCNVILEKQMPRGNRNCMRRQLFSYMAECRETLQEFQELIDQGPALLEEDEDEEEGDTPKKSVESAATVAHTGDAEEKEQDDDGWFAFLSGQDQQYTEKEIPVATAALALIKISRGAINLTLQACEAVGECLHEEDDDSADTTDENDDDKEKATCKKERNAQLLAWMETLHHLACAVGDGMTDLGAALYPPLQLVPELASSSCEVEIQIQRQADIAIAPLLDHVLDSTAAIISNDLPESVVELATKLKENLAIRKTQALEAIAMAAASSAVGR